MTDKAVHPPLVAERWPVQRRWRRLEDLCLGVFDCPHSTPEIVASGPLVVRSQDIRDGVFKAHEAACVSEETYRERIARAEPRFGDVLYSREGTYFGIAAEVPPGIRVCLGQRMVLIRPDPTKLNARFLRLWLNSPTLSSHLQGFRDGTVAERLNMPTIRGLPVPTFDRHEQDRIASILGALDDKIEVNRRMNETLEAMARAIFQDWFVTFGPTRAKMEGRPPYLAPDLWHLFPNRLDAEGKPEGWEASTIGQEVSVVGGTTPSTKEPAYWNGDLHWATPKDLSTLSVPVLLDTERRITPSGLTQIRSGLLPVGSVLLSSRAPIGYLAVNLVPTAINQGFIGMTCGGRLSNLFVWLWTSANMEAIKQKANGSTFQEISKANFRPLPVVVPSARVLEAFEGMVRPLWDRLCANVKEQATLAATRDLLLPRLMSGELRVKDAEHAVENAA
jgi:type I restriction enzyme S subunit